MWTRLYFRLLLGAALTLSSACVTEHRSEEPIEQLQPLPLLKADYRVKGAKEFPGGLPTLYVGDVFVGQALESLELVGQLRGWDINRDGMSDFYELLPAVGGDHILLFDLNGDSIIDKVTYSSH